MGTQQDAAEIKRQNRINHKSERAAQEAGVEHAHQEDEQTAQLDSLSLQHAVADPGNASQQQIVGLQNKYGNRAVSRLIQRKLKVGAADDEFEQEADKVAEEVTKESPHGKHAPSSIQRQEDDDDIQTKRDESTVPAISRKPEGIQRLMTKDELVDRAGEGKKNILWHKMSVKYKTVLADVGEYDKYLSVPAFMRSQSGSVFAAGGKEILDSIDESAKEYLDAHSKGKRVATIRELVNQIGPEKSALDKVAANYDWVKNMPGRAAIQAAKQGMPPRPPTPAPKPPASTGSFNPRLLGLPPTGPTAAQGTPAPTPRLLGLPSGGPTAAQGTPAPTPRILGLPSGGPTAAKGTPAPKPRILGQPASAPTTAPSTPTPTPSTGGTTPTTKASRVLKSLPTQPATTGASAAAPQTAPAGPVPPPMPAPLSDTDYMSKVTGGGFQYMSLLAERAARPLAESIKNEPDKGYQNLTQADITAIGIYTAPDYRYINPALTGSESYLSGQYNAFSDKPPEPVQYGGWTQLGAIQAEIGRDPKAALEKMGKEGLIHAAMATQALKKLPVFTGELWRGETRKTADYKTRYPKGKKFDYPSFFSATKDKSVADGFASTRGGERSVMVHFDKGATKTGRDIEKISIYFREGGASEGEVLFPPGSKFEVESSTDITTAGPMDQLKVNMKETSEDTNPT